MIIGIIALGLAGLGGTMVARGQSAPVKMAAIPSRSSLELSLRLWNGHIMDQEVKATDGARATINVAPSAPVVSVAPAPSTPSPAPVSRQTTQVTSSGNISIHQSSVQTSTGRSNTSTSSIDISVINE